MKYLLMPVILHFTKPNQNNGSKRQQWKYIE
jgi:hypothetical protein